MKIKAWNNIWLIILIFVFIGSQFEKGQSAEPNAAPGERIISFPTGSSMGKLSVRDLGSTEAGDWTDLGEARGDITVPAGKELRLKVPPEHSGDLSPLAGLEASDLQELILDNTKVGDTELVHLKGLTSLKLLKVNKKPVTGKSHPFLGKPLGELKFTSTKGEQIDISQYKGKVVLVDFWAVWCGPCIGELPNVKRTYNKYHDDGFEIIGISLDRSREKLEKFIEENDMPWPQYFDGKGWDNEISTSFDIQSIPSTFLLDGQGIVRYANLRGSALDLAVAEALGNPSSSTGQITDAGLAHLKGLASLETLHFENTQVGNDGLAHLKDLTSLKVLYLGGSEVTDAGLAHLRNLGTLEQLCVHNTKITNAGLAHLKDLTGLEYLCIHNTFVSDAGLAYLKGLTSLKTLYLHNTQVTDTGLDHLKGLIRLEKLNLRGTKVSNVGLTELKQALPNCIISEPAAPKARRGPTTPWVERLEDIMDAEIPFHLQIVIAAIAIPIVCLIVAVFLRIATRWAVRFEVPYWTAYKIAIITSVVGFVIGIPFNIIGIILAHLLDFVLTFFVQSAIYGTMIKYPESNESIGYGKGLLISLYLLLIGLVVGLVIALFIFILMAVTQYA
ncbi:MAG: redoxin domain-containing protein [Planctomycetes bacterium]|nr:redoxin domain-containing protein [Planctomycetota bacterium]